MNLRDHLLASPLYSENKNGELIYHGEYAPGNIVVNPRLCVKKPVSIIQLRQSHNRYSTFEKKLI